MTDAGLGRHNSNIFYAVTDLLVLAQQAGDVRWPEGEEKFASYAEDLARLAVDDWRPFGIVQDYRQRRSRGLRVYANPDPQLEAIFQRRALENAHD